MKIKNLLLFAAAASLSLSAFADELSTGELAVLSTGEPATSGQPTNDHFFVRGDYDDMGSMMTFDNQVSFKAGDTQLVWFYLDDDEIYLNEAVQALTPIAYNAAGDLYNEITYNSFQFDLYLPQRLQVIVGEDEDGEEITFEQGDRLPSNATLTWGLKEETKVIDGITYNIYTVVSYNSNAYGSHLSAKNASKYKNNGALKKDYSVFALQIKDTQADGENHIDDMIIANQMLNLRETAIAEWDPNSSTFFYGTGGNLETQRFQNYNRVKMHGSANVVENLAEKTINNVKYYNIAGMESNVPFDGVNIMVTTYNDGTTSTCKVMK
ncbi:MAG: hypothetical protein IJK93_08550 [Muribaculaceae bacterium]|nr:hypothetical protein [Muribaculaceae bacterium]